MEVGAKILGAQTSSARRSVGRDWCARLEETLELTLGCRIRTWSNIHRISCSSECDIPEEKLLQDFIMAKRNAFEAQKGLTQQNEKHSKKAVIFEL